MHCHMHVLSRLDADLHANRFHCLGPIQDIKIIGYKVQMFQVQRSICKLVGMNPTVVNSKAVMKTG